MLGRALANGLDAGQVVDQFALADDFDQQGMPALGGRLLLQRDQVVAHHPLTVVEAVDLLAPRQGDFARAQLDLQPRLVFHDLVDAVHVGRVRGRAHLRAHTERVRHRARGQQVANAVLVQVAAEEDEHVGEALLVQNAPHLATEPHQVAAVQADAAQFVAALLHLPGDDGRVPRALQRVIGVDKQHRVVGVVHGEGAECVQLGGEGHDVGVGHGARDGDAVQVARQHVGRGHTAGDVGRARHFHGRVGAVVAAGGEVGDPAAVGREHHARGLGRVHHAGVDGVEQERLHNLGFDAGRGHPQHRLVGEEDRALGHGPNRAVEAEIAQVGQEILAENVPTAQVVNGVIGEAHVEQVVNDLLQAHVEEKGAIAGQVTNEEVERGPLVHAMAQVRVRHGQFVHVGKQGHVLRRDPPEGRWHGASSQPAVSAL